ncbi:GNAT family N-acetyltransferase [filamentous cyanobacterium CCP5]|nr:GNAT family N-acetyltransferase [filamentous cyanobacterium CCP5]
MKVTTDNISTSTGASALSVYVRTARSGDIKPLSELLSSSFYRKAGWSRWVYPLLKLGISEDLRQRLRSAKAFYACLAAVHISSPNTGKQTDELIGTVEIACRQPYLWQVKEHSYVYLSNLAVRSDRRRRGVARKLLATCETVAMDWGFKDIYLHVMEDNPQARRLYGKAGYQIKETEETPLTWLGLSSRRLLLHKPLKKH